MLNPRLCSNLSTYTYDCTFESTVGDRVGSRLCSPAIGPPSFCRSRRVHFFNKYLRIEKFHGGTYSASPGPLGNPLFKWRRGRVTKEKQPIDHGLVVETRELAANDHRRSCYVISCRPARSPIKSSIFTVNTRRRKKTSETQPREGLRLAFRSKLLDAV